MYDVVFTYSQPALIYDDPPIFDFNTLGEAQDAVDAVVAVLNAEGGIRFVTGPTSVGSAIFRVGHDVEGEGIFRLEFNVEGSSLDLRLNPTEFWNRLDGDAFPWIDDGSHADFTVVSGDANGDANAAGGFVQKTFTCPKNNFNILPPGSRLEISDIVISADDFTNVVLKFAPGNVKFLTVSLDPNETVATNFRGQLESADEQGVKVSWTNSPDR